MDKLTEQLLKTLKFYKERNLKKIVNQETQMIYDMLLKILEIITVNVIVYSELQKNKNQNIMMLNEKLKTLELQLKNNMTIDIKANILIKREYDNEIEQIKNVCKIIETKNDDELANEILEQLGCSKENLEKYLNEFCTRSIKELNGINFKNNPLINNGDIDFNVVEQLCDYIIENPSILDSRLKTQEALMQNEKYENLKFLEENSYNIILLNAKKCLELTKKKRERRIIAQIKGAKLFNPLKKYEIYVMEGAKGVYLNINGLSEKLGSIKNISGKNKDLQDEVNDIKIIEQRIQKINREINFLIDMELLHQVYESTDYCKNNKQDYHCFTDEDLFNLISDENKKLLSEVTLRIKALENEKIMQVSNHKLHVLKQFPIDINGDNSTKIKNLFLISSTFDYTCGLKLIKDYSNVNLSDAKKTMKTIYGDKYTQYKKIIAQTQNRIYDPNRKVIPAGYQKRLQITK